MGFIDESQLDPVSNSGGRIIDESMLDPVDQSGGSWLDMLKGGVNSAANSALFGFGDEAAAGVRSILPGFQSYDEELAAIRGGLKDFSEQHPVASGVGTVAGALTSLPFGGLAAKGATTGGKMALGAGEGFLTGAAYGFGEGEGSADQRAENALKTGGVSSIFSPMALGAGSVFRALGSKTDDVAAAMNRKSLGARQGDYVKGGFEISDVATLDGVATSRTKETLDELLNSKVFGSTRDPAKMLAISMKKEEELGKQVNAVIQKAEDNSRSKITPNFSEAIDFITSGKVEGDKVDSYLNRLTKLEETILRDGRGALPYLQQQKIAVGRNWSPDDGTLNEFNRAIYADLQRTIEQAVPEVKPLNEQLKKFKTVTPILKRSLAAKETSTIPAKVFESMRTTGGAGVAFLAGTAAGSPGLGMLGAAALAARTPRGQAELARMGRGLSSGAGVAGKASDIIGESNLLPRIAGALSSDEDSLEPSLDSPSVPKNQERIQEESGGRGSFVPSRSIFSAGSEQYPQGRRQARKSETNIPSPQTTTKGSAIEAIFEPISYRGDAVQNPKDEGELDVILEAIRQVESSGGKYTTGPKTKYGTAKGSYQVLDSTGKEYFEKLGLEGKYDPYDEKQQKQIAKAILSDYIDMFDGDINKAITAYHTGPGNVKKGIIGPQGKAYLPKVEAAFEKLLKA